MKKVLLLLSLLVLYGSPLKCQDSLKDTNLISIEKAKLKNIDLNEFIYQNIGMPDLMTSFDKNLNVVVSFMIKKNGEVDSINIIKNPAKNFTNEVLEYLRKQLDNGYLQKLMVQPLIKSTLRALSMCSQMNILTRRLRLLSS